MWCDENAFALYDGNDTILYAVSLLSTGTRGDHGLAATWVLTVCMAISMHRCVKLTKTVPSQNSADTIICSNIQNAGNIACSLIPCDTPSINPVFQLTKDKTYFRETLYPAIECDDDGNFVNVNGASYY